MWPNSKWGPTLPMIVVVFTALLVRSEECPDGMYWCQDRCGTDIDTCCQTPDGQYNLCGLDTICCGFGCCPNRSYTCNVDFSCTGPNGEVIPPAAPNSTSQLTHKPTHHPPTPPPGKATTKTVVPPVKQSTRRSSNQPQHTIGSMTESFESSTGTHSNQPTGPAPGKPEKSIETPIDQPTIAPVDKTEQPKKSTEPPIDHTAEQPTEQYTGRPTGQPSGQPDPTDQPTQISTQQSAIDPTSPYISQTTDESFEIPTSTTAEDGSFLPSSLGAVVLVDTRTATLPLVTSITTFITLDHTFTLTPPSHTGQAVETLVIVGTSTATLPRISTTTTLTTLGLTLTLAPPSLTKTDLPLSRTASITGASSTQSLTSPRVTEGKTLATESQIITPGPNIPSTNIVSNPQFPITTASQTSDTGDDRQLPTYNEWPSDAVIVPVEREVEGPEPEPSDSDDGSVVIPCKLWFFSTCIRFGGINIKGWKLNLPSGIYPPGPPPPPNIKLPPGINFQGELPPWPKFTVGAKGIPTFPNQPEPTKCETSTASLCSTTTSYAVSTIKGALQTISSQALPPKCHEVRGCVVTDSNQETTQTKTDDCVISTVTDVVVTCSGTGTTDCSTETKVPKTGCSVSPTTATLSCIPTPTGKAQRQVGDNLCEPASVYYVWPRDGRNAGQTTIIDTALKNFLQDDTRIRTLDTIYMGINFWRVHLTPGQVQHVKGIPNVVAVYREVLDGLRGRGTLTQITPQINKDYRRQADYAAGRFRIENQMSFFSTRVLPNRGRPYIFDKSAGKDIPVYILDSGARIDHPEFNRGDKAATRAEFIYAYEDHDHASNPDPRDDAGLPRNGICPPGRTCNPHGTAMLGAVVGAKLGIAKKIKPYIVRTPRRDPRGSNPVGEDYVLGLSKISDRYSDNSRETRAILSMSFILMQKEFLRTPFKDRGPNDFDVLIKRVYVLLTDLVRKGIFPVTGAGNEVAGIIQGWPALFGANIATLKEHERQGWLDIPEILVVGAVDPITGTMSSESGLDIRRHLPHVYAPGAEVIVAEGDKGKWATHGNYRESGGTSISTAYTAGLAAYFLKLHEVGRLKPSSPGIQPDMSPGGLKRYIMNIGVARNIHGAFGPVLSVWNGAEWNEGTYCPYELSSIFQRQVDDKLANQCMAEATSTGDPTIRSSKAATATSTDDLSQTASGTTTTPSITTNLTGSPKPTEIGCTPETSDQCVLTLKCGFPRRTGCRDGKCVCILPPPPPPNPPQSTNKGPTTLVTTTKKVPPAATEKPKVPLKVNQRQCHDKDVYQGRGDITGKWVMHQAKGICGRSREIRPGESMTDRKKSGIPFFNEVPYFMSIHWKKGCEMDVKIVNPAEPLPGTKCVNLLHENWKHCRNNAGRGGFIDVGCLRYEFISSYSR
ncbi:hypothetical protein EMPG_09922 [Blastomyces silverae]|uniref:Peptidase S8/S53 domain-containing protein n=1 Tax=Blastomyces silverae TaxID=2060906 RepID=A0A0H1BFN8_9EURO|nr:hypothetical protein EMPG_09922 [Blastomyces silverae]